MANPLVSVIIPVFNGAAFLNEAVESVLTQTHKHLEIMLVDDGSTDDGVINLKPDQRLHVSRQENKGPAAARNAGIVQAKGDFIGFLDQDDRWLPEKLSTQLAAFYADPALDLCIARMNKFLTPGIEAPPSLRDGDLEKSHPGLEPSAWLCRRSLFDRVGLLDPSFRNGGDDSDWYDRVKTNGAKVTIINDTLVQKRIHPGNLSASQSHQQDLLKVAAGWVKRRREAQEDKKDTAE